MQKAYRTENRSSFNRNKERTISLGKPVKSEKKRKSKRLWEQRKMGKQARNLKMEKKNKSDKKISSPVYMPGLQEEQARQA